MSEAELQRIRSEFQGRDRTIPPDFYAWDRPEIQYWQQQTARTCRKLLERAGALPCSTTSIVDIGCGTGQWLGEFIRWGAQPVNLHGIDLLEHRVASARTHLPAADIRCGDARHLPWTGNSFDLVTQFTVFSSILDTDLRRGVAHQMLRVLRPGGHILWYDCRYPNPARAAVQGLNRRDVTRLFPNCRIDFAVTTLVPPLSRIIARHSPGMAAALEGLRFTCTHLAAVITKT